VVSYHHGWAYIQDGESWRELFNHARTAAYLESASALGCGRVYNVLADGGCESYRWAPVAEILIDPEDGEPLLDDVGEFWLTDGDGSADGWTEINFSSPALDPAPWYNPNFPESADALGFWVEEWTGLDSGVIQRPMGAKGSYGGGGTFGALGSTGREMGLEIILLGQSEAALDYLYRWLDATLASVCSTCTNDTIAIRRICPDYDPGNPSSVTEGVVELRQVGLVAGLTWATPPIERQGCFIRTVNVTLGALDPCMYGWCSNVDVSQVPEWDSCFEDANVNPGRTTCRPSCSELEGLCRTSFDYTIDDPSAAAPVVTISPPYGASSIPVRVRTYANPYGLDVDELCGAPLLGELYIASLPPYSGLRYDVVGRKVEFIEAGSSDWFNGFGYVEPNDPGVPRFFALGCGEFTTVIEPSNLCATLGSSVPAVDGNVLASAFTGGKILVAGAFGDARDVSQNRIARLNSDGTLDTTFNTGGTVGVNDIVRAIAVQPDGKIIIGGDFTTARGTTRNRIARLNPDGSLDTTFNTGGTIGVSAAVRAIVLQSDGKIIIGGDFVTARGTTQNRIARLNTDGTLDGTFNTGGTVGVNGIVSAVALQSDDKILVGGNFTTARGTTRNRIARLNADGSLDTGYNTGGTVGTNGAVNALALQPDGNVVIAGTFSAARGTTQNNVARLNTDGTLDVGYNVGGTVGVGGTVRAAALQSDGKVVIGGDFATARGTTQNYIARLNPDGTLDTTFNTGGTVGVNDIVHSINLRPADGAIAVGGIFSTVRGFTQQNLALLSPLDGSLLSSGVNADFALDGSYAGFPLAELSTRARMNCA
jgi:uncharacterized delta-60 repeat protein